MKIGLFAASYKKEAKEFSKQIGRYLWEIGHQVFYGQLKEIELDFIATFGGDGLVLAAAAKFSQPLLRVNFGTKGFLCNVEPDFSAVKNTLAMVLEKKYWLWQRLRLEAQVFNDSRLVHQVDAGNEIVIGGIPRTVSLAIEELKSLKKFFVKGDGILVSTAMGSTAYFRAAGGPVLTNENQIGLLANNAEAGLSSDGQGSGPKSIIFQRDAVFEVCNTGARSWNRPYLTIDGRLAYRLKSGDLVKIKESSRKTLFIELDERSDKNE